jgi:hypothetical protein
MSDDKPFRTTSATVVLAEEVQAPFTNCTAWDMFFCE